MSETNEPRDTYGEDIGESAILSGGRVIQIGSKPGHLDAHVRPGMLVLRADGVAVSFNEEDAYILHRVASIAAKCEPASVDALRALLQYVGKLREPRGLWLDNACPECVKDYIGPGEFRCGYHKARAALRDTAPTDDALPSCEVCGGSRIWARPKYPGTGRRLVCPTCMADRLDIIAEYAGHGTPPGQIAVAALSSQKGDHV